MATSTEAHVPPSFPIQPSQLHLYQNILPSTVETGDIDSTDDSDTSGSENESETSDSSSESSEESEESETETDEDADDEDRLSHVQTSALLPSDSSDQPSNTSMQVQIAALEAKVKCLESELDSAKAHCAIALSEVGLMKKQLNKRQKKTQARNINARWLTSAEGLRQCEEQDEAREAKAQKKAEVAAWKASKQASRLARRAMLGSDIHFTGALSTKSKEDLIDIANQLKIETTGTKAEVLKAIREYFDAHADLKNDARFEGLFNGRSRGGQKRTLQVANITENEENISPSTNRQRIDPPTFPPSFMPPIESPAPFSSHRLYPPMQFNSSNLNYPSSSTVPQPFYPPTSHSYYSYP